MTLIVFSFLLGVYGVGLILHSCAISRQKSLMFGLLKCMKYSRFLLVSTGWNQQEMVQNIGIKQKLMKINILFMQFYIMFSIVNRLDSTGNESFNGKKTRKTRKIIDQLFSYFCLMICFLCDFTSTIFKLNQYPTLNLVKIENSRKMEIKFSYVNVYFIIYCQLKWDLEKNDRLILPP